MVNIENEVKILLNKENFFEFRDLFNNVQIKKIWQTNYYFEDSNFNNLKNNKCIRIRKKCYNYTLTIKEKKKNIDDFHESLETNRSISKKEAKYYIKQGITTNDLNYDLNSNKFEYIGKLKTYRENIIEDDVEICFDINYYLGLIDYEIEFEGEIQKINKLLKKYKKYLPSNKIKDGKYKRFVKKLLIISFSYFTAII